MTIARQKSPPPLPTPHAGWPKEILADLEKKLFYLKEESFPIVCGEMEKLEQEVLLRDMRLDRDFYKKVMEESHREKRPGSYRYVDAQIRIDILNRNGKILKQLIK